MFREISVLWINCERNLHLRRVLETDTLAQWASSYLTCFEKSDLDKERLNSERRKIVLWFSGGLFRLLLRHGDSIKMKFSTFYCDIHSQGWITFVHARGRWGIGDGGLMQPWKVWNDKIWPHYHKNTILTPVTSDRDIFFKLLVNFSLCR